MSNKFSFPGHVIMDLSAASSVNPIQSTKMSFTGDVDPVFATALAVAEMKTPQTPNVPRQAPSKQQLIG